MLFYTFRFAAERFLSAAAGEAFKVVANCQTHVISEPSLIKNQVVDIVELLALRLVADKFLSLFSKIRE